MLSNNAGWTAIKSMFIYTGVIIIYNSIFNQNLLDLREPTLDIERFFGEWPVYILVNIFIALIWYYLIYLITRRINIIKVKSR